MTNQHAKILASLLLFGNLIWIAELHAQQAATELTGPGAVGNQRASDKEDVADVLGVGSPRYWDAWKARVEESAGLDFGLDYNLLGFDATRSQGDDTSASGVLRFFGQWELANRGAANSGSLVFKIESRHAYTDYAPSEFGSQFGYAGVPGLGYSDQGTRITHLFWRQTFADGRGVSYIGVLDVTDYTDVYALASPWSGFSNLAFENGSGAIGGLPDGALGVMVGGFINDNTYLLGGIADANGDPTDILNGFNTLFGEGETFKSAEIGWTPRKKEMLLNNVHLTFWQVDAREDAGTPDGSGVSFSMSAKVGKNFLPFLRAGWARNGGATYDKSLSAGFGYSKHVASRLLGLGLNWSSPNPTTYGADLRNQLTVELFQLLHLTKNIEITPSVQYIRNPSFATEVDSTLLLGLRLRAAF